MLEVSRIRCSGMFGPKGDGGTRECTKEPYDRNCLANIITVIKSR